MKFPIALDYDRDALLTDFAKQTLNERYLIKGEKSPQDAFARAACAFATDKDHAQRMYDYASKRWFMFSTPILSNGGSTRGLPISCFLNYVEDSRAGLVDHWQENVWLSTNGGGIGGYWGEIRSDGTDTSSGSRSTGSVPFMKVVDSQMLACSQGRTRRGSYAAYQNISHPEVEEFITMRKPTGGDSNRKCLNLHHGLNVTDDFMELIERCLKNPDEDDSWPLVDPHSGKVVSHVSAKKLWQAIIETRTQTGEPYLHFIDASNRALPEEQKALGLRVNQSNLCSEITLPTSVDRTAICCLSSLNLETYDEWKDTTIVADLVEFLDNVISCFIEEVNGRQDKAEHTGLQRAAFSAGRERSLGLGAMGFHNYLQKMNIPIESAIASGINQTIFSDIKGKALEATLALAKSRGEAPDMAGSGRRNAHLLAIAPNASSSIICGTSPSIEPIRANIYTHKTLNGSFLVKNKFLEKKLEELGHNTDEVWSSILSNGGSVCHLEVLDDYTKQVFRTAIEVDQRALIDHAATRQEHICQAQSLNLFFRADEEIPYLHEVHFSAWKKGLKTLYYCRSEAIHRVENVSLKVERRKIEDDDCFFCQG
jgi:ribonucleoside-diphosphate reductase alpha chain